MRGERPKTGFGRTLRDLFESRKMSATYTGISKALGTAGYEVSHETVARWSTGNAEVPQEVLPVIARLLDLTAEEKQRLGQAFAWEQDFSVMLSAA